MVDMRMPAIISIPKKLLKKGELVILPRKDYEEFLHMKKRLSGMEHKEAAGGEGNYRPSFVRKILKRSKEKAPYKFKDRASFLKQVHARK